MKAVILAGGFGSRLAEETHLRPKPMVEIGGMPILWHVMKIYAAHGIREFVICLGYKAEYIKQFFSNYYLMNCDVQINLINKETKLLNDKTEDWEITLIDTGLNTMTGGRLRRVAPYLGEKETFCFTYGDGVGDIDVTKSIAFHLAHGGEATVTAAMPPGRFGALRIQQDKVLDFQEKPDGDRGYVNAGFFVLNRSVLSRISGDSCVWEQEPLMNLAKEGQLHAFKHHGFWQPMDTVRDRQVLEQAAQDGTAPWITWT